MGGRFFLFSVSLRALYFPGVSHLSLPFSRCDQFRTERCEACYVTNDAAEKEGVKGNHLSSVGMPQGHVRWHEGQPVGPARARRWAQVLLSGGW